MKRGIVLGGVFCVVLGMLASIPVFADWTPSKTQQEIISASGSLIKEETVVQDTTETTTTNQPTDNNPTSSNTGNEQPAKGQTITSVFVTTGNSVPKGIPVTATGHAILSKITEPMIKVTPLSETQSANQGVYSGLGFHDKKFLETDSGLTYLDNEKTNIVYKAVSLSQNTSEFLSKFEGHVHTLMEELIIQKLEAKRLELQTKREEAERNDDMETLSQIDAILETIEHEHYGHVDNYSPFAVFDVAVTDALREQMGEDGKVSVALELNGVNPDSDMIALHFRGDIDDADVIHQAMDEDFANTLLTFDVEVLDVVVDHGMATIELSSFSPIMLMMRGAVLEEEGDIHAPFEVVEDVVEEAEEVIDEVVEEVVEEVIEHPILSVMNISICVVIIVLLVAYRKHKKRYN